MWFGVRVLRNLFLVPWDDTAGKDVEKWTSILQAWYNIKREAIPARSFGFHLCAVTHTHTQHPHTLSHTHACTYTHDCAQAYMHKINYFIISAVIIFRKNKEQQFKPYSFLVHVSLIIKIFTKLLRCNDWRHLWLF